MLPEYDFSKGVRGKYAKRYHQGSNVVVLAHFPQFVEKPTLSPRVVELAMRRLNEPHASDPERARRAFDSAQAAARRLASGGGASDELDLVAQSLNGFIDSIVYDRANWPYQEQLARFLAEHGDRWPLSRPLRDGLLHDTRELLRHAQQLCTQPADRAHLNDLEQQLVRLLEMQENKGTK